MNQLQNDDYEPSGYSPEPDIEYRGDPQGLAIITLILGCFSFLAYFKTLFWAIPIFTVVLGALSLFALARNPNKIGRKAALAGMALAVFFGSWTAGRHYSRQYWLTRNARQCAHFWFDLVQQNKLREAHQLLIPPPQWSQEAPLDQLYASESTLQKAFEDFFSKPPLGTLVEVAPRAVIEFVGLQSHQRAPPHDDLVLQYVARYQQQGQLQELLLNITVRRSLQPGEDASNWYIVNVQEPNSSSETPGSMGA